jgi:hypothetical protein
MNSLRMLHREGPTSPPQSATFARARDVASAIERGSGVVVDAQGAYVALDGYGRILSISGELAAKLGFDPERLIGRRFVHRVASTSRTAFASALAQLRESGRCEPRRLDLWTRTFTSYAATLRARSASWQGGQFVIVADVEG